MLFAQSLSTHGSFSCCWDGPEWAAPWTATPTQSQMSRKSLHFHRGQGTQALEAPLCPNVAQIALTLCLRTAWFPLSIGRALTTQSPQVLRTVATFRTHGTLVSLILADLIMPQSGKWSSFWSDLPIIIKEVENIHHALRPSKLALNNRS